MDERHPHRAGLEGSMKVLRAIASAFVLVILLFAVPWVIIEWGSWSEVRTLIADPSLLLQPDDGHFVLAVLTVLGALFWVLLACGILLELIAAARHRGYGRHEIARRGSPVRWARTLVRPLVAAIFALSALGSTVHAAYADVPAPVPIAAGAWTAPEAEPVLDPVLEPAVAKVVPETQATVQYPQSDGETVYVVAPGDSLWSIAEKMYGDGRLWTRIAEENEDVVQGTSDLIRVGWRLTIPPIDPSQPDNSGATPDTVVVTPGESLWSIANQYLGDGAEWPKIAEANEALITDPNLIQPGWQLVMPTDLNPANVADSTDQVSDADSAPETSPPWLEPPGDTAVPEGEDAVPGDDTAVQPDDTAVQPVDAPVQPPWDPGGDAGVSPVEVPSVVEEPESAASQPDSDDRPIGLVAGVTAVLAGGVILLLSRRRLGQLRARPVGRRILQPGEEGQELETALGVVGSRSALSRLDPRTPPENEAETTVGVFADDTETWWAPSGGVRVCVGEDDEGEPVFADVNGSKPFLVCGESDCLGSAMRGIAMNMAVEEADIDLNIWGGDDLFDTFANVDRHGTYVGELEDLRRTVTTRRTFLGGRDWEMLRADPNFGEAWRPVVYIFIQPIGETQFIEVAEALQGPDIGVAVLVCMAGRPHKHNDVSISGRLLIGSEHSILDPGHIPVHPCSLEASPALTDLLQTSISDDTTPAWWSVDATGNHSSVSPSIERGSDMITFNHPTLKLLGPIQLEGAQGVAPNRAERSCMEYCAWLLEHPGTTASAMSQGLMVAEGTRRSNMSRLRSWLGQDPDGNSYLPEAYSGRIWLHAGVTSDWHRMRQLISGGVEEVDTPILLEALELVRGVPLADAAPGQWHWAEEIRTDMMSVVRDIGVLVASRCLSAGDIEHARWAANRALVAAPEDELLLGVKVKIEHTAGNKLEADRLITWITRNARNLGIDLLPQTADILREVMSTTTGKE